MATSSGISPIDYGAENAFVDTTKRKSDAYSNFYTEKRKSPSTSSASLTSTYSPKAKIAKLKVPRTLVEKIKREEEEKKALAEKERNSIAEENSSISGSVEGKQQKPVEGDDGHVKTEVSSNIRTDTSSTSKNKQKRKDYVTIPKLYRWEHKFVNIERSFPGLNLKLRKWVKVPVENDKSMKIRKEVTVETGKDGMEFLVGGFMQYICPNPKCGKIFTTATSLKKHMHIHGERQFACDYPGCGKRFLDKSKLRRHMAVHDKEKDYIINTN